MFASVLLGLLAAVVVGVLFLLWGIRGKRLDDHPTCRQCGFDLENVYPAGVTCPECGAGLKRPKSVRIGQRRKRPVLIGLGLLLMIAPVAPIAMAAFAALTGKDFNEYLPLGVLVWEGRRADAKSGKGIANELLTRMTSGKLAAAQEDAIVDMALDRQENADLPWDEAWGDLIERGKLDGRLSEAQQQRFLKNAIVPRLRARPRVAVGDPIPVAIEHEVRVGGGMQAMVMLWLDSAKLDGKSVHRALPAEGPRGFFGMPGMDANMPLLQTFAMGTKAGMGYFMGSMDQAPVTSFVPPDEQKVGPSEIELVVLAQGINWNMSGANSFINTRPPSDSPKVRRWVLKAPIQVAAKDAAGVQRISPTDELTKQLSEHLRPNNVFVESMGFPMGQMLMITLSVEDLPAPVAFDVYCQAGEADPVKVGSFTSGNGGEDAYFAYGGGGQKSARSISGNVKGFKGGRVDLVLKPRPDLAARTTDLTRVYDGEVVIKNVDVQKMNTGVSSYSSTSSTTVDPDPDATETMGKDGKPIKHDDEAPDAPPKERSWLSKWLFFMK
jgi:hypothetical protein